MSIIITNAFSLNMLNFNADVKIRNLTAEQAKNLIEENAAHGGLHRSAIGHADMAAVASEALGMHIPMNRSTVELVSGDMLLVAQYSGPRLPEGATTLPEGATIKWMTVSIQQV